MRVKKIRWVMVSIALLILLCNARCKKFIEPGTPPTQILNETVFSSNETALSAVMGLYSQLTTLNLGAMSGGLSVYAGLSADEIYNTGSNANLDQFTNNSLNSSNSIVYGNFWTVAYKHIYQANLILEGLQDPRLSPATVQQLSGEVKVIRALYYMVLVNLFGDVPLVTTTDYALNAIKPRTAAGEVYAQIIQDLEEAEQLLPESYASSNRVRINKWTAAGLLARCYLQTGVWDKAAAKASEVLQTGLYPLNSNPANVFLISSTETIWQIIRENNNTAEGAAFVPSSATARPTYALRNELVNIFETGDRRKAEWVKSNIVSGVTYYYPAKYKARTSTPVTEYNVAFRSAELYLIRAEARAEQNEADSAIADINKVRLRAGVPIVNPATQAAILTAIEKERQRELFAEWGHRWTDLKRTGRANIVLSVIKPSWQPDAVLYPIPFTELQRNPMLVQNPGY